MKSKSILGLALIAAFALAAFAASSASAAGPEWYECAKVKGAKFEKGCGKEGGKGGYEIKPGVGKGKVIKGKLGLSTLHTFIPGKGDVPVVCTSGKSVVTAAVPNKVIKNVSTFSKCKAAGAPCQSGSKKETIVTETLAGELGYITKSPLKVGIDLANEASPGAGYLAKFTCTGVANIRTFGSVIGEQVGDINTFSKTSELKLTVQTKEYGFGPSVVNNPTKFEGGPEDILLTELEAAGSEKFEPPGGLPSGQEGTAKNKGEELEIKA